MKKHATKVAIALAFLVFVFLFFYFDLERFFTLARIHSERARAVAQYEAHPIETLLVFTAVFIAYIQTGFLGTFVIMMGFGAVFGTWVGAIAVGFAYAIGGTIQFWLARYLFRDWVHKRWGHKLAKIDAEMARDGNLVLLGLRLISLPYASINVLMALTPIRTAPFFFITLVADAIVGAVYTNAGTHLAGATRYRDLVDTKMLASLAVLGVFPLLVKLFLALIRKKPQV